MKILSIDTSGGALSVALLDGDTLRAEYLIDHGLTHSQRLMPLMDTLLRDTETEIEEIDAFAAAKGPGSFTGLRIGVASVKALGFAEHKPVVGVNTLEALCENLPGCGGLLCPMLDARNKQVFAALYRWEGGALHCEMQPQAALLEELCRGLSTRGEPVWLLGGGAAAYGQELREALGGKAVFAPPHLSVPRASSVAAAARRRLAAGECGDGRVLVPEYLRKSQAEQEKEHRRKMGGQEA